jgi:hypothetical protein
MQKDERVAHSGHTELVGTIQGIKDGTAEVHLDGGGKGYFPVTDLVAESEAKKSDKTWPPSNFETKVPGGLETKAGTT